MLCVLMTSEYKNMRKDDSPSLLAQYTVAVGITLLMLVLRSLLLAVLGISAPFILFFLAITVSAWYGGLWPGLLSTGLSALLIVFLPNIPPAVSNLATPARIPFLIIFLVIGVIVSLLQESLHRSRLEVAHGTSELGESQERFHLLVDSVKDYGIFMLNPNGDIVSWNTGAERIKGYRADEIIGQNFSIFYTPEDIARKHPQHELEIAKEQGRYEEEGWRLRKDGTRFWANIVITAVYDNTGELRGFSKVTRDLTEYKKAEERHRLLIQEQAARAEAEEANRAKDQFLSIVSHELRTPLNAIIGWTYLLRNGDVDANSTTFTEALESIERNGKIQARLVEDLLDVSRMLAGKLSIQKSTIELAPIIEAVVNTARPSAAAKNLELQVHWQAAVGPVEGDAVRLEQVIWNLLSNAIKFTPEGGRIIVRLSQSNSQAEITISDTGRGIDAKTLPFIFDYFRQADSSSTRQHGGLGLGLAIVRHVVEAHEGSVEAQSPGPGQGATFTVRLPLKQNQTQPLSTAEPMHYTPANFPVQHRPKSETPEHTINVGSGALQGLQVLAVDDEKENLNVITAILSRAGAAVRTASSTANALEVMAEWHPDVLVADIGMPVEDGYVLINKLRSSTLEQGRSIPAVALTAYASIADRHRALEAGFQEHLAKPVEPDKLTDTVARLAGREA